MHEEKSKPLFGGEDRGKNSKNVGKSDKNVNYRPKRNQEKSLMQNCSVFLPKHVSAQKYNMHYLYNN